MPEEKRLPWKCPGCGATVESEDVAHFHKDDGEEELPEEEEEKPTRPERDETPEEEETDESDEDDFDFRNVITDGWEDED